MVKIIAQIEGDDDAPRTLARRLLELEREEEALDRELGGIAEAPVVRLPANYAATYQRAVEEIGAHLATGEGTRARPKLR